MFSTRGREFSHQEHGIVRLHVPHEAEHPDLSSRGLHAAKTRRLSSLQAPGFLDTGSGWLLLKLSLTHTVTEPSKLQGDPSAAGPYHLVVLRASGSPSPSRGSWNFSQGSRCCPPHPRPPSSSPSHGQLLLRRQARRECRTAARRPINDPSYSAFCRRRPLPDLPGRPHCPPSRSATAPARASRRASRRGRSAPGLATLQTAQAAAPQPHRSPTRAQRPIRPASSRGAAEAGSRPGTQGLVRAGASRLPHRLLPQLPPPYPRPQPAEPNLGQTRTEVTSRRAAPGAGRGSPAHRHGRGRAARATEPGRAGPLGRGVGGCGGREASLSWLGGGIQGQEEARAKVGEGGADREGRAKRSVGAGCAAPSGGR